MCAGCRILGQKCLDKNRKTILADMRAVNSAQTHKLTCLMCNLLLLTEDYCAAFSADLLDNLGTMLHDTFHSKEYQKVIHLIARFAPVSDVLKLLRAQLSGTQSVQALSRLCKFCAEYATYCQPNGEEAVVLVRLLLSEDNDCIEDVEFVGVYACLILRLIEAFDRLFGSLAESSADNYADAVNLTATAAASVVQRMEDIVERQPGAFRDIFAEFSWQEEALDVFRRETQNWMVKVQNELDLKRI